MTKHLFSQPQDLAIASFAIFLYSCKEAFVPPSEKITADQLNPQLKMNPENHPYKKLRFHTSGTLSILFFILCSVSISCQRQPGNPKEIVFSRGDVKEYHLAVQQKMDMGDILQPENILYKNGLLVLTEGNVDTLIHLLDAETLDYLSSKGVAGYGPGEIPSIWNLDSGPSDSTFWAYSLEGKTFNEYSLYSDNPLASQQIKQSEDFFLAVGIAWASPHSLMTYLASGEDKYVEYNLEGERISSYGKWKDMIPGGYPDHVIPDIHQGRMRSNLKKSKIAKASIYRDRIEILDKGKGEIVGIVGPDNVIAKFTAVSEGAAISGDFIVAYTDLWLSENYIFALYSGKSDLELMETGRGKTEIFVFNYQGKPVALLKTDVPISTLTIDEAGQMLYAITEEEDPTVAVFELPELD